MKKMKLIVVFGIALASCSVLKPVGKNSVSKPVTETRSDVVKTDSTKKALKSYNQVITAKAITQNGLFKVHKVDERWFFEIPDSLFNRDILIVNRISKSPPLLGYGGDQIGENVIQFSRGLNNKLLLKRMYFLLRASDNSNGNSENSMSQSVQNSNYQPISAMFDIKAVSSDSTRTVFDMTDYLNGDNDIFFFGYAAKSTSFGYGLEGYQADKSFIDDIRDFPLNIEIKTVKTYIKNSNPITFELNSSIILLPKDPMSTRYMDKRVGYFARGFYDFEADRPVDKKWMATRWRLEPKPEDREKYLKGELVEPQKPIIYYIDPATPKKWIPYLIMGVNDWQKAFEKAGFKHAIYALEAPANDPTWSLEDARHSAIVYKASPIPNASGPQVGDPRSGEILETHINWFHNVQELIHDWYMIQAGPNDPQARKMKFDDALMGQLIRFVCSHEVGHTLGLRHNFLSSSLVPTDSLRSKHYVRENGFCPSIMDYARFNYVAQPEDSMESQDLQPRIGDYDKWAIEWGYRWFPPFKCQDEENTYLTNWVTDKLAADKRLLFGTETLSQLNTDPSRQSEDLGDDAVKAGYYGIKNLKRILSQLKEWTKDQGDDNENLGRLNKQVWDQYFKYSMHVATRIGGVIWSEKYAAKEGDAIKYLNRTQQKDAVQFLLQEVFNTPAWLVNHDIYRVVSADPSYIEMPGYMHLINILQRTVLQRIISYTVTNNLLVAETSGKGTIDNYYPVNELFSDLETGIFKEIIARKPIDIYRRNLQKLYVDRLIELAQGGAMSNRWDHDISPVIGITDVAPIIKGHLHTLLNLVNSSLVYYTDQDSKLHVQEIRDRIKKAFYDQTHASPMDAGTMNKKARAINFNDLDRNPEKREDFAPKPGSCWAEESVLR